MKFRQTWTAVRALLILTVALGIVYPLTVTLIGQLAFPHQSNGSLARSEGAVIGSSLIGQSFTDPDGTALPEWFQSRPSAAGYDASASSGSNYGPENEELLAAIEERTAAVAELNGVDAADVPIDAVTASASGLDPHISVAYADLQVQRVAEVRGLTVEQVQQLVDDASQGRDLGYLGEETVNVLRLNIALAELES